MDDYITGLLLVIFIALAFITLLAKESRLKKLHSDKGLLLKDNRDLSRKISLMEEESYRLRKAYTARWKGRAEKLQMELKEAKRSAEYLEAKKMENLDALARETREGQPMVIFLDTSIGITTLREALIDMISRAEFEVDLVSPWIKEFAWQAIRDELQSFTDHGGSLRVFTRPSAEDSGQGVSMEVSENIRRIGGEIILVEGLHAKLYLVDRREAIVASANLTKGGLEINLESGVLIRDPDALRDIGDFLDGLYRLKVETR
jgi:sugar-specific transcriptional regulator TrmB